MLLRPLVSVLLLCSGVASACAQAPEVFPRVFLIGDSTMADKPLDLPERGWGMALGEFLVDASMVRNHAANGRSTKSFIEEGRWKSVREELRAGDFVMIQFGHNDEKREDPVRYTDPATSFRENLKRFICETRDRHAIPILLTPVARRKFDARGELIDTHGKYPEAVRAVAREENVALLDLTEATMAWLRRAGDEPSRRFFMWLAPGEHPKVPEGRQDDTHFVAAGAEQVARFAVEEIRRQQLPLARWLRSPQ